jgi:hypothetical protein
MANEQMSSFFAKMNGASFDPAVNRAHTDAGDFGSALRGDHVDLAVTERTPLRKRALVSTGTLRDALNGFDGHFGRPDNSSSPHSRSRKQEIPRPQTALGMTTGQALASRRKHAAIKAATIIAWHGRESHVAIASARFSF